jgi:hypothetical protein
MTAVNSLGDTEGGLCRVGGTPLYYQEATDTPCAEADMITYVEDCEEAFNYLAIEGYSFYGEVLDST